jgi:hypothetical protein
MSPIDLTPNKDIFKKIVSPVNEMVKNLIVNTPPIATTTLSPLGPLISTVSPTSITDTTTDTTSTPILITELTPISLTDTLGSNPKYLKSVNISYTKPSLTLYENLSADPAIQKRLAKYYYYKILDNYLFDDLIDLLAFFNVKDGKVQLITSTKEYNPDNIDKDTEKNIKLKIEYIEKNILTKNSVFKFLKKYVNKTGTRWVDLPKNEFFLIEAIGKYLKKKIKKMIN